MSERKLKFEENYYYHIYNRGTDKRKIFIDKGDLYYFFDAIQIVNQENSISSTNRGRKKLKIKVEKQAEKKLVSIVSYCLLPNHFHFILKQEVDGGIPKFMGKLCNSYSKFFNSKYERTGALFQGRYKASLLAFDNSFERTSAYVNINYKHHKYNPEVDLIKTSLFEFLGTEIGEKICEQKEIDLIIKESGGMEEYKKDLKEYGKEFLKLKNEEK